MEKITKHNYEAFYLDYIEGNLSKNGQTMLFEFLGNNPNLKTELEFDDDVLDFILKPTTNNLSIFEKKNLKQFDCRADEICLNNVDNFIIAELENDISGLKQNELNTFITEHKLEKRKATFFATKLQPNLSETYPNHGELKKKGLIIPLFVKIASIAAVGLLFFNIIGNDNSATEIYNPRGSNFALHVDSSDQIFDINFAPSTPENNIANTSYKKIDTPNQRKDNKVNISPNFTVENTPNFANNNEQKKNDDRLPEKENSKKKKSSETPILKDFNDHEFANVEKNSSNKSNIKLIDMYKPVTSLTNSYTNLDVSYKKSTAESDLRITYFHIGKFSFERKRNN